MGVFPLERTLTFVMLGLLAGCASFPASRGLDETHKLVADRGGVSPPTEGPRDCTDSDAGVAPLVAHPLTPESAVQITLMCNAELAAEYARFGIARADTFQAARIANPTLSAAALDSSAHGAPPQIELGLVQNFTSLLLSGPRTRLAEGEFLRMQQQLAGKVLQLAAETKADYYTLVGAQQVAMVRHAIADALRTSAELAQRFHDAGNLTARALADYQATAGQALADARNADNEVASARSTMTLQLGLPPKTAWVVPDRLPVPVAEEDVEDALLQRADTNRLDLAAARKLVTLLADSERTTEKFRWLGDFNVGVSYERDPDRSRLLGPSLSIQLPIFDQGQGPVARARALKAWGDAEQRRLTQAVVGSVQLTHQRVLNARDRAQDYRTQIIPQRQIVVARTQEEQNFMLVGVFELFAAKRAEFDAYQGYLDALRDYWIARADLERAVGACLPSDAAVSTEAISTQQLLTPPPSMSEMQHMHHGDTKMPGMEMPATQPEKQSPKKSPGAHAAADHEH
ncbi:MAG: TolC family protein, partial [Rudaea sp.]